MIHRRGTSAPDRGQKNRFREQNMRKPFISGNWKMNGDIAHIDNYLANFTITPENAAKRQVILGLPFTILSYWAAEGKKKQPAIELAAQDVYHEAKGAFTGEISVSMLAEAGCSHCIIGHSERRAYFHESDKNVNDKMNALIDAAIIPIVCVGETLEEREADRTVEVITSQVAGSVVASKDVKILDEIVIAYEPVWAIGTGKTATPEQAEEVCALIREQLKKDLSPELADKIRILYGGSVNAKNIDELMAKPNIDGVLVGGASLKADEFSRIANYIEL